MRWYYNVRKTFVKRLVFNQRIHKQIWRYFNVISTFVWRPFLKILFVYLFLFFFSPFLVSKPKFTSLIGLLYQPFLYLSDRKYYVWIILLYLILVSIRVVFITYPILIKPTRRCKHVFKMLATGHLVTIFIIAHPSRHFNVESTLKQRCSSTLNQGWILVAYESWGNVETSTLFQPQISTLNRRWKLVDFWLKKRW